ncbi:MAG: AraC family transcriptional regulator, partial [Chromatiaceae bacterium]
MAFTTLSSWALLVWEELDQRGLDADVLFRQSGLDPTHLNDPNARFPVEKLRRMWVAARELTNDPALGVAIGMRWNPTTFHALGYAWLASSTLAEGFHRLARYGRLISDQYRGELSLSGMEYRYRGTPRTPAGDPDPTAVEAITVAIIKMCRLLAGEGFSPLEIVLPIAPGASVLHLETNLRSPLKFGDQALELVLARADMEKPLRSANPELSRLNEQIVVKHLSQMEKDSVGLLVQSR